MKEQRTRRLAKYVRLCVYVSVVFQYVSLACSRCLFVQMKQKSKIKFN